MEVIKMKIGATSESGSYSVSVRQNLLRCGTLKPLGSALLYGRALG